MNRRILVTGSRTWEDKETIRHALHEHGRFGDILVSGACPAGADALAEAYWRGLGPIERHPAGWDKHGRRAGFVRNSEMVRLGADICLAFIRDGSRGATMTADIAARAGIRVIRYLA